jgi:hypothetical protein
MVNNLYENRKVKVPPGGFRGGFIWQSLRAATRNPVEALRYE